MAHCLRCSTWKNHPAVRRNFPGLFERRIPLPDASDSNLGTVGGNLSTAALLVRFAWKRGLFLKKGARSDFGGHGVNKYHANPWRGPSYIVHPPSDLAPMLSRLSTQCYRDGTVRQTNISLIRFFTLPAEGNLRAEKKWNVLKMNELNHRNTCTSIEFRGHSTYRNFKERDSRRSILRWLRSPRQ